MLTELHFYEDVTPRDYLHSLLERYPYDIDEKVVYSLLDKACYPHPCLIAFLQYFTSIGKIHIMTKTSTPSASLQHLWEHMIRMIQQSGSILHVHQFSFDATYQLKVHHLSHPYAHLPLSEIPFLREVQLHTIPIIAMQKPHTTYKICKSYDFLYRNISMDAKSFIGICIRIGDRQGIVFLSRGALWFAAAIAAMYPIIEPSTTYDFMLIFGLRDVVNQCQYYYDQTNSLYIGLVSGNDEMLHFLYLKEMVLTLYNAICIQKHDLPIHASMVHLSYAQTHHNLVFAGAQHSGKSELLDAITMQANKRRLSCASCYDDSGILHYLDNAIVSTGSEVSACKDISYEKKDVLFQQYPSSIFLKEDDIVRYQITPLTTYESSLRFYPVHALFYLHAKATFHGYRQIQDLEEAIALFHGKEPYFCGTLAVRDYPQKSEQLIREFFTILFVQNIPIYELSTKGTPYQKQFLFTHLADLILAEILHVSDCV